MLSSDLQELIEYIQKIQSETVTIEVKSAHVECPRKLYDTLSSFSNQDDGGIIIFGLDGSQGFKKVGVYDAQDLQKKVGEQCKQMEPPVRPLFTIYMENDLTFVAAEIPGLDLASRPCFYKGKGIARGSYIRVGDADEQMTDYEIYSFDVFRKKYEDDIRVIERASHQDLDQNLLDLYIAKLKVNKQNLAQLAPEQILNLMSMMRQNQITLAALLLFGFFPQAFFPQLDIIATVVPGTERGAEDQYGERFLDSRRIDGPIAQQLEGALNFVLKNMKVATIIDPETGRRHDRPEYPLKAVRESILNALVHRDYSVHTEGMPIQIVFYQDRLEIVNPGGLFGRIRIEQLGKVQPNTRNPVLANALEILDLTENRYAGIPTIYREMKNAGLPVPQFRDERGQFTVFLYNTRAITPADRTSHTGERTGSQGHQDQQPRQDHPDQPGLQDQHKQDRHDQASLLVFCETPRSRQEIAAFLNMQSVAYAISKYVTPLVTQGLLGLSMPEKPGSRYQRFQTIRP